MSPVDRRLTHMPEPAAHVKRRRADGLSMAWATIDDVVGICVFGSVARGDASERSDIDMIVLSTNSDLTSQELLDMALESKRHGDISVRVYTSEDLVDHLTRSPIFAAHLKSDGIILLDRNNQLSAIINRDYPISISDEINWQRKNVELYEHSERFGHALLLPLARLYSIGRAVVFLRLFQQAVIEFNATRAFAKLGDLRPEWRNSLAEVGQLRPFFQSVRLDDIGAEWPFDPFGDDARERFESARGAVHTLLTDSCDV